MHNRRLGLRTSKSESALEQIPQGISMAIKVEKPGKGDLLLPSSSSCLVGKI